MSAEEFEKYLLEEGYRKYNQNRELPAHVKGDGLGFKSHHSY